MKALLLVFLIVAASSADYCESTINSINFFATPDETRIFALGSYIKGYDLQFTIDDQTSAKLYSSYSPADKQDLKLQDYKAMKSVDVRRSAKSNGMGFGAILAQKQNEKQIAVWIGKFDGYNKLPDLSVFRQFTLPQGLIANCFDLRVADDLGAWAALNCQTIPQTETQLPQDLLCSISTDDTELSLTKNCKLFSALVKTRERKSAILISPKGQTYLLSSNTHQQGLTAFITIYYFNSNKQFVFSNIIDATQSEDANLEISDFVITNDNTIVVADAHSSRLLAYTYSVDNQVVLAKVINYPGRPLALAYNADINTLVVATKDVINQHDFKNPSVILNRYEVDPSDGLITTLQTSKTLLSYSTLNKNLYIYERSQYKINYLLVKQTNSGQSLTILSQQNSYIFSFTPTVATSAYVSQPFLQISQLKQDKTIKITAKSTSLVCELKLNLKSVANGDNIVNKAVLQGKSFKVDPVSGLKIQLDSYFGGSDLSYNLLQDNQNKDFSFDLNHLNKYQFTPTFQPAEASTILQISPTSFYYIGVNTIKQYYTYIDICTIDNQLISCVNWAKIQSISKTKKAVDSIKATRRSNGQSVVIYSYKYSGRAEWIYIERKGVGFTDSSYPFPYTSLYISDSYFMLVSKTARTVSILFEKAPYYTQINDDSFTATQLTQVQYFYPRQTYIDRTNINIFYVKLPTKIAKFHILDNHSVQYLGIVRTFDTYKLDSQWSVNFDANNVITYRDNAISEEYYNSAQMKFIKTHQIPYNIGSGPIQYDQLSQISYIVSSKTANGEKKVKLFKSFQGAVDFQYYELTVNGDIALSGNWLLDISDNPSVYFVDKHPTLTIFSSIPQDKFKEDVKLTIQVKGKTNEQKTVTQIEGVNYPVTIKNFPNSTINKLPSSASSIEIKLPVDSFFSGPVAYYALSCPMCGGSRIRLYGPMAFNTTVEDVPGIVDFVQVGDKTVALSFSKLFLMNSNAQIISSSQFQQNSCTNLQFNKDIGLLIFCTSETGQQILKYSITNNNFEFISKYVFHAENRINNFDQMFAIAKGNKNYLYILDNDQSIDSNSKKSTIKAFDITEDFTYIGEWTSKTFTMQQYPINDFEMINNKIFVTLGNFGIGYGTLNDDGSLSDTGSTELASIPAIKDALLDDSFFKQVQVLSYADGKVKIFLTTTNSLSMVISFTVNDISLIFDELKQSYYRYGNERLLNWHSINSQGIYLSYYNQNLQLVNIVYYKRVQKVPTHFINGVLVRVSKNQLKYHQAFVVGNKLLTSHLTDVPTEGELTIYNLYNDFVLWLNYEEGGTFNEIQIQAFNDYKSSSHTLPIQFEISPPIPPTPPGPDGVKWYIIVIVCLSVLIAVGAAYGLFRYMKKKRAEKSVSLLTQREQEEENDHETEEERERQKQKGSGLGDSTTKDGLNRSSINAAD